MRVGAEAIRSFEVDRRARRFKNPWHFIHGNPASIVRHQDARSIHTNINRCGKARDVFRQRVRQKFKQQMCGTHFSSSAHVHRRPQSDGGNRAEIVGKPHLVILGRVQIRRCHASTPVGLKIRCSRRVNVSDGN